MPVGESELSDEVTDFERVISLDDIVSSVGVSKVLEGKPKLSVGELEMSIDNPELSISDLELSVGKPKLLVSEPFSSVSEIKLSVELTLSADKPELFVGDSVPSLAELVLSEPELSDKVMDSECDMLLDDAVPPVGEPDLSVDE